MSLAARAALLFLLALGAFTMLVALGWSGAILWRQRARRQAP